MNLFRNLFALTSCLVSVAAPVAVSGQVSAQTLGPIVQHIDANYARSYGGSLLGGNLSVRAEANVEIDLANSSHLVVATGRFNKSLNLLGRTVDVLTIDADAALISNEIGTVRHHVYNVRMIDGLAVWNEVTESLSLPLPVLSVFPGSGLRIPVPVGPLTISVRVNAGVQGEVAFSTSADPQQRRLDLTGSARGWANGRASASAGIAGIASVGVRATMRFGDLTAQLALSPQPGNSTGSLNISLLPIAIDLDAFLTIRVPLLGSKTYRKGIYEWSMAAVTSSFPLQ